MLMNSEFVAHETTVHDLPDELLQMLFTWLSPLDLLHIGLVCSVWKRLVDANVVWRIKNEQHGIKWSKGSRENQKELFFYHNEKRFFDVPPDKRILFYALIENDTTTVTLQNPIYLYDLLLKNSAGQDPLFFLLKNNHPLQKTHVYQQIKKHSFKCDPEKEVNDTFLLYWAVSLQQPIEEVKQVGENHPLSSYQSALDKASEINYVTVVQYLLEKNISGLTYPLSLAASNNHVEIVRLFMDRVSKAVYEKAILDAAAHGHVEVLDLLVKEVGAFSAILPAVASGKLALVKWFFETMVAKGVTDKEQILKNRQTLIRKNDGGSTPLQLAALKGYLDIVVYLLTIDNELPESDSTLNLRQITFNQLTALQCAIESSSPAIVECLLKAKASLDPYPLPRIAIPNLVRAVMLKQENVAIVNLLIQAKADVKKKFKNETVVYHAYKRNKPQSVAALVLAGAEADAALICPFLATHGQLDALKRLIDLKGLINKAAGKSILEACFLTALEEGQSQIVIYLMGLNKVTFSLPQHKSALHEALRHRHVDTVQFIMKSHELSIFELIESGEVSLLISALNQYPQKLEARNTKSYTPLMAAAAKGFLPLVELFIARGANIKAVNHNNQSALYLALEGKHRHIVDYLLDLNDDILLTLPRKSLSWFACIAKYGDMVLMQRLLNKHQIARPPEDLLSLAINYRNIALEAALISQHTDPSSVINQVTRGSTALERAIEANDGDSIRLLLDMGAKQRKDHEAPISTAIRLWKKRAIHALIEKDKDILRKDYVCSPLCYAISVRRTGLIRYLIYKGADVTEQNLIRIVADNSSQFNQEKIMRDLLLAGARVDINQIAQVIYYYPLLKLCLEFQPELMQQRDKNGNSLLTKAVEYGTLKTVKLLFAQNASISEVEKTRALWTAIYVGKEDIIDYLLKVAHAKPLAEWDLERFGMSYDHKQYLHLVTYIERLQARIEEYKWSLTLFGQTIEMGFSKTVKLEAAFALKAFLESKMTFEQLALYRAPLSNGNLGNVFDINIYRF